MSVVWNSSVVSTGEINDAVAIGRTLAPFVVFVAVIFNFVLCFVNTKVFSVSTNVIIVCEIVLIATSFSLIWYRGTAFYVILSFLAAYFFALMLARSDYDPKILRDLVIPFIFFFLGSYLGSLRGCDRLVTILIMLGLGAALFEWLALNTYLHYFNVIQYYVARGTETNLDADSAAGLFIRGSDTAAGLFINSTRFDGRNLLPFLGQHRVSGIFLEPVSVGNFGAIAFAWVLLRDRFHISIFVTKILAIAAMLVLADARFGCYICVFTVIVYLAASSVRPTMLFLAPFVVIIALVTFADDAWDNTITGRLISAGSSLATLDPLQVLGLRLSTEFTSGYAGDSGFGYALVKVGLVGLVAIWALFAYAPVLDGDAWRFKNFIAIYIVLLLAVSASLFSIKTSALLWFLYGTLNNPDRNASTLLMAPWQRAYWPMSVRDPSLLPTNRQG